MKTHPLTISLPDGAALAARITVYAPRDVTQPEHDDLYRPEMGVWAVAQIDHPAFKNRFWLASTDTAAEARQVLRVELDRRARETLGYPVVNPYVAALLSLR